MLNVIKFIKDNKDWEKILSEKPYSLIIKKESPYILLKYNQIESDFSNIIVQECRGLIIREDNLNVCRYSFDKFFNYGETNASPINWDNYVVEEKIDGSLISLWYDEKWNVSTNGVINAENSDLSLTTKKYKTFYDLFNEVFDKSILDNLNKDYTYTFEICSPYSKIVVPHETIKLYHLATRNNITLQEINEDIGIQKPKSYTLNNIDECIKTFNDLDFKFEGYVVKDTHFNRIKIKNPSYVDVHHLKGEGGVSRKRVLGLIQQNEQEEFLNYFPEYEDIFDELEKKYDDFIKEVSKDVLLLDEEYETRKDLALTIKDTIFPSLLFQIYDKKILNYVEYISKMDSDKLLKMVDG